MKNHAHSISPSIREALEHIGITRAEQFVKKNSVDLWGELNTFWDYFPKKKTNFSLKDLQKAQLNVIDQLSFDNKDQKKAYSNTNTEFKDSPLLNLLSKNPSASADPASSHKASIAVTTQALERLDNSENNKFVLSEAQYIDSQSNNSKLKQNSSKAIRARHPIWTYTMAILTVFAIPIFALVFFLPFIIYYTQASPAVLIIGLLLACIYLGIYAISSQHTCCEICQCKTFTLSSFPHNKFAHRYLFFGVSLSTALHIIFTTWYRCPACGSAKKLFKAHSKAHSKGHEKSRHKMNRSHKR